MLKSNMKADLIIKNAKIIDVFQNEIYEDNVAIKNGVIIGIGDYSDALEIIDANGMYLAPNLIDGHVHIESSMVSPAEFLKTISKGAVTTIIADPHEITNVCGIDGITYIIDEIKDLPAHVYIMLPSCVPATDFETSGAILKADDYLKIIDEAHILGLGEMMDYKAVIDRKKDVLDKLELANSHNMIIDGHAPLIFGKDLDDYVLANIKTDHECSNPIEMKEKIRRGMYIQLREGTAAKNMEELLMAITKDNINRCFFCTDDRHPYDLINEGSIDNNIRKAIKLGLSPLDAIKMATLIPSICYNLKNSGAIAPGFNADFFLFEDLNDIRAKTVFFNGEIIVSEGEVLADYPHKLSDKVTSKMNIKKINEEDLKLKLENTKVNVIELNKDSLITNKFICDVELNDGYYEYSNPEIKKIIVIERHTGRSQISIGLIKGYDIKNGAVGTTISHDSHNIVVVGDNDIDILNVIREIEKMKGGMAISSNNTITESLPLDIAGIMSSKNIEEVDESIKKLHKKARELGIDKDIDPFMTIGFMALPVIPSLKMTDKGLFDVDNFKHISVEA